MHGFMKTVVIPNTALRVSRLGLGTAQFGARLSAADARALLKRVKIISPAKRPVPSRHFELMGEALLKRRRIRMRYLTRTRGGELS